MSSRNGWHGRLVIALIALAGMLIAAAPAGAATSTVKLAGGTTALKLDKGATKTLKRLKIKLTASKPAKEAGGTITFPISGGAIDPATGKGTIAQKGGLTFRVGAKKVALTSLTLNTGKGVLSAKVGKKTVAVGTVSMKKAKVTRDGLATNLAGVQVKLSAAGAKALRTALAVKGLKSGLALGVAAVKTTPAEVAISGGTSTLTLDAGTATALSQLGVKIAPVAPATATSPVTLSFPLTGGTLNATTLAGMIQGAGGLQLSAGSQAVPLMNPTTTLGSAPQLVVDFGGSSAAISSLDISKLTKALDPVKRTLTLGGVTAALNAVAANTLNGLFNAQAFAAGTPIGTIAVDATLR